MLKRSVQIERARIIWERTRHGAEVVRIAPTGEPYHLGVNIDSDPVRLREFAAEIVSLADAIERAENEI